MRFDEELTHERIAQRLGTTPGGVARALGGILDHLAARTRDRSEAIAA